MGTNPPLAHQEVESAGFSIVHRVFEKAEVDHLINSLSTICDQNGVRSRGGVYAIRNLLTLSPVIRVLACSLTVRSIAEEVLWGTALPVRATLFDKTPEANWLVPWHQDLTICPAARLEVPGYGPWTRKAGLWHVQPPASVLERMLSVRIHLDDCSEHNGALRLIPGTHRLGRLTAPQIVETVRTSASKTCDVEAGGVLLMRPLLLHSSSAGFEASHRRVIHIDYASGELNGGLRWPTVSDHDAPPFDASDES